MTEIPEHLLKRAQARRAAMTGGGGDSSAEAAPAKPTDGGAAPAAASAAPAPKKAAPLPTLADDAPAPKPDIPVVAAAKSRKKIPYWAAPVLLLLPVWGMVYADSVTEAPKVETDPMVIGAEVFAGKGGCAGCHGADGSGGPAGAQLKDGHALETFADPLAMVHWVAFGYAGGAHDDGTYGDVNRPKLTGQMPAFKDSLTPEEIASVVIYVRSAFSPDQYDPENEQGFTAENYEADPDALAAEVEAVIGKGPGGDVDLSDIARSGA